MITLSQVREEKALADALANSRAEARVRVERDRKEYIESQLQLHPEIGVLNGGKFYAFTRKGYVESKFLSQVVDSLTS